MGVLVENTVPLTLATADTNHVERRAAGQNEAQTLKLWRVIKRQMGFIVVISNGDGRHRELEEG